jgi:predicted GIY-YIG superfamily endonuclease
MERECSVCGEVKNISEYYVIKKTGYTYKYCKKCHIEKTKPVFQSWRKKKRERFNELARHAQRKYKDRLTTGVYMVKTNKGFYIGCSNHVEYRVQQHFNPYQEGGLTNKGYKIEDWIILEEVKDRHALFQAETKWIQLLQPEINIYKTDKK